MNIGLQRWLSNMIEFNGLRMAERYEFEAKNI